MERRLSAPETYGVRGAFTELAFNRWKNVPGVSGLSGNVDGTEKGGTLNLAARAVAFDMPNVFKTALALDSLTAQTAWTRTQDRLQVKLVNAAFANADAAGTLSGVYHTAPQGRGEVDLTGALSRADASSVPRYIPVTSSPRPPWRERAFVGGKSTDVRFE